MRDAASLSTGGNEGELLLQEVNGASAAAQRAWIVLIALEAYFLVALAGISHRDLLLNTPVAQPILQVSVPLRTFILFGPLVLIAVHAAVLQQHAVLVRKLAALDRMLAAGEVTPRESPARLRLHGYYLTQIEAGPRVASFMRIVLGAMDLIFLRVLPLVLILAFQITYLPVHDTGVTAWHRVFLVADLLLVMGAMAHVRAIRGGPRLRRVLLGAWTGVLSAVTAAFSIAIATVPGEGIDRFLASLPAVSSPVPFPGLGTVTRNRPQALADRRAFWPTAYLFEGEVDDWSRSAASLFTRNLIVVDEDLVPDNGEAKTETSFSLRGRDLNFATFDRSDLQRVDLTDASLIGASLAETNLEKARIVRVRMQGADLTHARLSGIRASAVILEGARLCAGPTVLPMDISRGIERPACPPPQ